MAMMLPLLPEEYIPEGIVLIRSHLNGSKGETFSSYLQQQWLPKRISVWGSQIRTNNYVDNIEYTEEPFKMKRPTVWVFLRGIRRDAFMCWFYLMQKYFKGQKIRPIIIEINVQLVKAMQEFSSNPHVESLLMKLICILSRNGESITVFMNNIRRIDFGGGADLPFIP